MNSSKIPHWLSRSELLLGEDALQKLINSHVLVVGLGGVGGIAAEMIARAGVGRMTIIDADVIEASNRNRQLVALTSTNEQVKAEVLGQRLLDINPELKLEIIPHFIKDEYTVEILERTKPDFALDCIDTLSPKVYFIKSCLDLGIPFISSMGAGGKVDPTQLKICDISKTYNDNLARYVRKLLHRIGIKTGVQVVFSLEKADQSKIILADGGPKKSVIGTISYMPAVFGCACASAAIRFLYTKES